MRVFKIFFILVFLIFLSCQRDDSVKKLEGTLLWKVGVGSWLDYGDGWRIYASPAISQDGTIYTEGCPDDALNKYYLYALNPDGTIKWRFYTGDCYGVSSITIGSDGTIYAGCVNGLIALNPDGTLKWRRKDIVIDCIFFPALGADNTLYTFNSDYELCAVNPDGTIKWRINLEEGVSSWWGDSVYYFCSLSSLVIGKDGTIYFVGEGEIGEREGDFLVAINPNGTLKWLFPLEAEGTYYQIAIGKDGLIYFGSDDYCLYVVNPDGTLKGKTYIDDGVNAIAIAKDGTVYVAGFNHYLYALSSSLEWKWEKIVLPDQEEITSGSLTLTADGTIYIVSSAWDESAGYPYKYYGYLYAFNSSGELKWKFKPDGGIWVAPTIGSDGNIYFNATDGYFYAVKGLKPLANSPWPKYQNNLQNTGRAK